MPERKRKRHWLERFRDDGCFLIDPVKEPLTGDDQRRTAIIGGRARESAEEAKRLRPRHVVLVKKTVWDGLSVTYFAAELPVLNTAPIPFPGSGHQIKFREAMRRLHVRDLVAGLRSPT